VFNVGSYRRSMVGAKTPATFFSSDNEVGLATRKQLAQCCMDDLKAWLREDDTTGRVAVFDATNTTRERREWICDELSGIIKKSSGQLVFVESVVNDDSIIEHNIREVKLSMPDYDGASEEQAIADFKARIQAYVDVYEPMGSHPDDAQLSWVRVEDGGRFVAMNRIRGFLPGRACQLLSVLHTQRRPIYFTRHGKSEYNKLGKIGGDSPLCAEGEEYAKKLGVFAHVELAGLNADGTFRRGEEGAHARLWTSSLRRTIDTARYIKHPKNSDGWVVMRPRPWVRALRCCCCCCAPRG